MKPTEGSCPKCGGELRECPGCWVQGFCPNCEDDCSEPEPVRELKRIEAELEKLAGHYDLSDHERGGLRMALFVVTQRIKELKS